MTKEEQEQLPETAVSQSPPAQQKTADPEGRGELIKFGILALVLLGAVAVVALSRPLIFERALPAIVQPSSAVQPLPAAPEDSGMGGALEEPAPAGYPASEAEAERELFLPSLVTEESAEEGGGMAEEETAVDSTPDEAPATETEPILHVVQVGDTLTRIAGQYNVPVQALMEANGLINPNYIQVGQTLKIPVTP